MVSVDTVYQKVLSLANKEQRGYITPQEFNLMASKAQLEIFENYFHDLKTGYHKKKNENPYADEVDNIFEKLQFFKQEDSNTSFTVDANSSVLNLAVLISNTNHDIYKLDTVSAHELDNDGSITNIRNFTELNRTELIQAKRHPLASPTIDRPVFVREGSRILRVYPPFDVNSIVSFSYWRKPVKPIWNYVVVNQEALYNYSTSVNFELHPSEEENLVTRILALSGISMKNMELAQAATVDEGNTIKKQND
jgi:hypothetical protein